MMTEWLKKAKIEKIVLILLLAHMLWKVGYSYFLKQTSNISEKGINYIIENVSTITDTKTVTLLEDVSHITSTVSQEFFVSSSVTLLLFLLYLILLIVNKGNNGKLQT